ncbi:hypothetical protein H6F43_11715 [Leptolyngbya sp. FACHB-36]|uniref:hypothetical protein n=1 Tax=Leptolyngbya sp. FACHB-36 TaxID=2692808 RepID=UPI0016808DC1|nr:hypothetical protein [Leptolyngbya sp. FACHB-36]MBD2020847.1 hypothetical protein [Leptolyngbya sp. FACHB-36]
MRKYLAIVASLAPLLMGDWMNKAAADSPSSCSISSITPGQLAIVRNGKHDTLSSRPDESMGAQLAIVTLTCTGGLDVSINPPVTLPGTPSTTVQGLQLWEGVPGSGGVLLAEKDSAGNGTGVVSLSAPISSRSLSLQLFAASPGKLLPVGTYTYRAVLTITPR